MLPIIPSLALGFVSFICSVFVILRIVVPILPPHPLSKRVSPAEFGLPTFRALSPADKSHLWLASLDLVSLAIFIWQVVTESTSGTSGLALATDTAGAIRLWIVVTVRPTCLLMVSFIALLHVRMAQSVTFGATQWILWAPTLLLTITSTAVAGILSEIGIDTLFYGLTAYSASIALFTALAFAFLINTLFAIKNNLTTLNEPTDPWPPVRQMEDKARPSFATEDMDAMKDGVSWLTSEPGSRRQSISTWSFSTHHTATTNGVPPKSSFWFTPATASDMEVPPVPPLPSPYGPSPALTPDGLSDPDPFRRDVPQSSKQVKAHFGSQCSWFTSSDGSHAAPTAWSFSTTQNGPNTVHPSTSAADFQTAPESIHELQATLRGSLRSVTPAGLSSAQVLGGYGYAPGNTEIEKGLSSFSSNEDTLAGISWFPVFTWSVFIWLPLAFALPYFIILSQHNVPPTAIDILFILSVTLTSPLLTFNLLVGSPLPIPVGLFDSGNSPTPEHMGGGSFPPTRWSMDYKRSTSTSPTVVEGRRSGDVWISKGDAIDGKGKFSRAVSMLNPAPKLSVLPLEESDDTDMPPIPFQSEDSIPIHVHGTPHSENSAQFGRLRTESRGSSRSNDVADDSVGMAGRIMVAQRHYSALAHTVVVQGANGAAAGNRDSAGASTLVGGAASGIASKRASYASHLRTRSTSSSNDWRPGQPISERNISLSPPPSFPLPPTPPSVRAARLAMLAHKKSFSSGVSLSEFDDINEIDAMTAGVLPLLVPGLIVGEDMKIKPGNYSPPGTLSKHKGQKFFKQMKEFGDNFSSVPEIHSIPAKSRQPRLRKGTGHKKNHLSLPSLSVGKDGIHAIPLSWGQEICTAIETEIATYSSTSSDVDLRRNTVVGIESAVNEEVIPLQTVREEEERSGVSLVRNASLRSLGLNADVPRDIDSLHSSIQSFSNAPLHDLPPSANSEVTLFEEFEADLQARPQSESTPHNNVVQKSVSRRPPPIPERRWSSIRYVTSNKNEPHKHPRGETMSNNTKSPAQWITRTRSVVPKASKISQGPSDPPVKDAGLRQLALLQDRANVAGNVDMNRRGSPTAEIRPLTIGKKQKSRIRPLQLHQRQDENASISIVRNKNIKELTLSRSETTKARGILRQTEVLPQLVVRPPSSDRKGFAYSFGA